MIRKDKSHGKKLGKLSSDVKQKQKQKTKTKTKQESTEVSWKQGNKWLYFGGV